MHLNVSRSWATDWVVTAELAVSLIEEMWPALKPVSGSDIGAGWDNSVYLINSTFVFRFPRRAIAVPLIATEISLLPWLASAAVLGQKLTGSDKGIW